MKSQKYALLWITIFGVVCCWSVINPKDYVTWVLEVFPAFAAFMVLIVTYKRFRFTTLAYSLILIHCCILFVGGHYTYAEVPFFNWIRDTFHQSRNNYDKLGHFAQGFIPAIVARELFIRFGIIQKKGWLTILILSVCLAISSLYELFEWLTAILAGEASEAFLGTQGYAWDTQSDMLFAFMGAFASLLFFSNIHDTQLKNLRNLSYPIP